MKERPVGAPRVGGGTGALTKTPALLTCALRVHLNPGSENLEFLRTTTLSRGLKIISRGLKTLSRGLKMTFSRVENDVVQMKN